jgi:hypothetical protein
VRREIAFALEIGKPIVVVLVGTAAMPSPNDLPDELKPLLTRQFRHIHSRDTAGVAALVDELAAQLGERDEPRPGTVALVRGASAGLIRDAVVKAGIPEAVVRELAGMVRLELPEPAGAVAVAGDFLRVLNGVLEATGVRPVRVALHYDEPVTPGLLDEPLLDDVLAAMSGARAVVLLTEAFHGTAVAHGHRGIDKTEFAPVRLRTGAKAWVHVPGSPYPRGVPRFEEVLDPHRAGGFPVPPGNIHFGDVVHGDKIGGDKYVGWHQ